MGDDEPRFWRDAFDLAASATPRVLLRAAKFTLISLLIYAIDRSSHFPNLGIEAAPYEFAGAVLGLLLVLRTNAGYDRWWEGRRLWGGIVNQSRDLAVGALSYGPNDAAWRASIVRWT